MTPSLPARLAALARRQPALLALLLICLFAALRYDSFATPRNLFNVLRQNSMAGLMALGMLFAMLSGGIDLSAGAMLAVGAVTAAALSPYGAAAAMVGALVATAALGAVNGLVIARAGVQPFIATLVMNMASRGVLLFLTAEESVRVARSAAGFKWLARGWLGPVPVPVLLFLAAFAAAGVVLASTRFGRRVRALGDNDEAARLMGLNVDGIRVGVYAVSAALAGLGGALLAARLGVGQPTAGLGWELGAITAVILGSTALAGGQGGAASTLVGVLLLAVVFNLFNLEGGISSAWQGVLRGAFLLVVVVVQTRVARRG